MFDSTIKHTIFDFMGEVYIKCELSILIQLSSKMIEGGNTEDLERELEYLKRLHQQELEALEAEMNAEENEHSQRITKTIDDDHTSNAKQKHRDILKEVSLRSIKYKNT